MYYPADQQGEFRQGEIISGIIQYVFDPESEEVAEISRPLAILANQDCDLLRDHEDHLKGKPSPLGGAILYPVHLANEARQNVGNSDVWKRARQNDHDRWHVLQSITADFDSLGIGIEDMVIDFRQLFTIPSDHLRRQVVAGTGHRRSRLEPPYRDHFQARAMYYLSRVALDPRHQVA